MKLFIAFAAFVAVAVAVPVRPTTNHNAEIEAILAAINSPNTNPATAALLEQQLHDIISEANPVAVGPTFIEHPIAVGPALVEEPSPISVGPALVEEPSPISVGPAFVEEPSPISVGPALVEEPSPIAVGPALVEDYSPVVSSPASSPLVQIIVNVNQASDVVAQPIIDRPIPGQTIEVAPTPVQVVDAEEHEVAPSPIQVIDVAPTPVQVIDMVPAPIQIVEQAEESVIEPVIVGTPILPIPVVNIPEILN